MDLLPFTVVLVVFCGHVSFAATSSNCETGLTESTNETCSQNFVCNTTGPGSATEILIEDPNGKIEFRHTEYENGAGEMSVFGGDVIAGNLSRLAINGTNDYCFTTNIRVQITENTRCKNMTCQTRRTVGTGNTARDEIEDFGSIIVTSVPQPPSNITVNQTINKITFAWNPATNLCSSVEDYDVSTSNCGNCSTSVNETTCLNPIEGQNCSITIKTRTQCAVSEPVTRYVLVIGTSPNAMTMSNLGKIIGGVLGGTIGGTIVVVMLIIGIIILCLKRRFSGNKTEVHHKQEQTTDFGAGETTRDQPVETTNGARNNNNISQDDRTPLPEIVTDGGAGHVTRSPAEAINLNVVATSVGASGTTKSPAEASLNDNDPTVRPFPKTMESSINGTSNTPARPAHRLVTLSEERGTEPSATVAVNGSGCSIPHPVPTSEDSGLNCDKRFTKLEDKIQKLEEDMKSVKLEVQRLKDEIQTLRTKCQELEEIHKVDTAEIEQLKAQIRDLEQQLAAAKTREEKLERKKSPRRIKSCGDY